MEELKSIMEKFAASDWDLIAVPAQQQLSRLIKNVEIAGAN